MEKLKREWKKLFNDKKIVDELRHLYRKGEIPVNKLVAMLHQGEITISEYVQIIREQRK